MNKVMRSTYSYVFYLPALIIFSIFFIVPTVMSLFFSLTIWDLSDWEFVGLENFYVFLTEPSLSIGFKNTFLYAITTATLKVVFGLLLGIFLTTKIRSKGYLRSVLFFPVLLSTIAVGITFSVMMHPTLGIINTSLQKLGIQGIYWLTDDRIALFSVAFVDVWKGVGFATVIFIAGILAIPEEYFEALQMDGGNAWNKFWNIIVPLSRPATNSVIILAFIGGMRSFDLIWSMTQGGPGFSTDVIASIIYKQYQAGFYGLATAGNVILFIIVSAVAFPLYSFINRKETEL